jgi:uncharacterized membrane protein YphA (DoxX/SURF4 family)
VRRWKTAAGTVGYFQSIGYPEFFAYLVIFAEVAGGAALIAGFYARYVALALVPVLIGDGAFALKPSRPAQTAAQAA